MATVTTTNTLDITVVDSGNYETTFKINNPKTSVTSVEQVRTAFATAINGGWWISRFGQPMANIARVSKTVTEKTQLT